jgi:hypothetical protein
LHQYLRIAPQPELYQAGGKPVRMLFHLRPSQALPAVHQGLFGSELSGVAITEVRRCHERHDSRDLFRQTLCISIQSEATTSIQTKTPLTACLRWS